MIAAYVGYLALLWYWSRTNPEEAAEETIGGHHTPRAKGFFGQLSHAIARVFGLITGDPATSYVRAMIVSILAIAALSYGLVDNAVVLSNALGHPPLI